MSLALLLLAFVSPSEEPEEPPAYVKARVEEARPLATQSRSAHALVLPTAVTPEEGAVTASLTVLPGALVVAPALGYTPLDGLTVSVGGIYLPTEAGAVGGQAKLQVSRTSGGRLSAAVIGGGGYVLHHGLSVAEPLAYGGAAVSACLGTSCGLLLSGFGGGIFAIDDQALVLAGGASALIRAGSLLQFMVEVYGLQETDFPIVSAAARLTPRGWTLDLGAMMTLERDGGPLPVVSVGHAF